MTSIDLAIVCAVAELAKVIVWAVASSDVAMAMQQTAVAVDLEVEVALDLAAVAS